MRKAPALSAAYVLPSLSWPRVASMSTVATAVGFELVLLHLRPLGFLEGRSALRNGNLYAALFL